MASTSRFSALPQINIGRSRWMMNHDHPTSWEHGRIIPIDCVRVMPGDTFKLNLASLIRMSQPIVPIMDNIRCNYYAFFVPQRLLWEHQKEFCGENTTGAGPQLNKFYIPSKEFGTTKSNSYGVGIGFNGKPVVGSVSHYLHKPLVGNSDTPVSGVLVSVLKERAYWLIYNEFFRAQQFMQPVSLYKDDTEKIGILSSELAQLFGNTLGLDFSSKCAITTKQFDYFTSGTLSPQYGPSVEIPLGDYAPLGVYYNDAGNPAVLDLKAFYDGDWVTPTNKTIKFGPKNVDNGIAVGLATGSDTRLYGLDKIDLSSETTPVADPYGYLTDGQFRTNLIADLSSATAASINTLRAAFATQRFLERNNYGTRYHEYIQVHFGVKPPLGLLQVPELIGEHHFNINVQQVLSTAGAQDDATTKLGQPGANSVTGDKCMLFKKSFVEHGYVMIMMTTTHDRHYTSGILRDDLKRELLEFYHPEFATLGDQATKRLEIQYRQNSSNDATPEDIFGYQEHWAEYRYIPSQASGLLDPNASSALAMWTLTNTYDADVALDTGFLLEDRNALAAALVTGNSGPDYIGDFYFNYDVVRPMPLYSIPGRIDHVGNW